MKFFTTDSLLQNGVSIYICCRRQWRQAATASAMLSAKYIEKESDCKLTVVIYEKTRTAGF